VPSKPFPRVNETAEFNRDIAVRRRRAIWPIARMGMAIGAVGLVGVVAAVALGAQGVALAAVAVVVLGAGALTVAAVGDAGLSGLRARLRRG
jgi:hypothetical protein